MAERRGPDHRKAAEAAFKSATKKVIPGPAKAPALPNVKETVTLRLDQRVLEFFQREGAGWQDRINDALVALMETAVRGERSLPVEDLNASNDD
jgi:uncharacterized protein (DUF4415 family)